MSIVIQHVNPPFPGSNYDWCAFPEGKEETGPYGWGKTKLEAVVDLYDSLSESLEERV